MTTKSINPVSRETSAVTRDDYIPDWDYYRDEAEPEPPARLCIECGYRGEHAFGCPAAPDDDETEETDHDDNDT